MTARGIVGACGGVNLHARRVIWHRHGILGVWRLRGGSEVREIRGKVEKRIQDNRMCM